MDTKTNVKLHQAGLKGNGAALSGTLHLPCSVPCSKCGSEDIYRRFYAEGKDTNGVGPSRSDKTSDFVNRDDAWHQPAKKDCITNVCRCCGFRWDSEPIKPNIPEQPRRK